MPRPAHASANVIVTSWRLISLSADTSPTRTSRPSRMIADAVAGLLHLAQDVRGEEDGAAVLARLRHHAVELVLVERVQAIGWLVQNQQARAMHERLHDANLALIAAGILAELAGGVQAHALDQCFEIGLIDAAAQMAEVFENLATGQVRVERQFARQIADQPLDLGRLLPAIQSADTRAARCRPSAGPSACGWWWFCPRRSAPESRRLRPPRWRTSSSSMPRLEP